MSSNDTPTNPEATRKEESKKKALMGPGEIARFNDLLIRALFGDNIKSHASDAERELVFGEIRAVCLTRGLSLFIDDLKTLNNSFIDVMASYGTNVASYMQTILDSLHEAEREGNATSPDEQLLLQFFQDRGVQPRRRLEERIGDPFMAGLRKYAVQNGIDSDLFDELVAMTDDGSIHDMDDGEDGWEDCNCPYHRIKHAMVQDSAQCQQQEGYSVVCPDHGRVFLSNEEYTKQLLDPDRGWLCPECGAGCTLYEEEDD